MRKQTHRKPRPIHYPMLVIDHVCGQELEIANWNCLNAFMHGLAAVSHFKHLNDMANVLIIAGTLRKEAKLMAEFVENDVVPILQSIKNRFEKVGRLGLTGGDIEVLRDFIKVYNAYWKQESSTFLVECQTQMQLYYRGIENE